MFGLTPLGIVHTAISLVAVASGFSALIRDKYITPTNGLGKLYIATTVLTCLTALGIFQHGGFGKPHALAIITLVALGVAATARLSQAFGRAAIYVEAVSYSATLLFHLIPAVTETATRLPVGAPLAANADAPILQAAAGLLVLVFVVGATSQVIRLRARVRSTAF